MSKQSGGTTEDAYSFLLDQEAVRMTMPMGACPILHRVIRLYALIDR
jgi:hypothetical protein